jgi:hypothetical protein
LLARRIREVHAPIEKRDHQRRRRYRQGETPLPGMHQPVDHLGARNIGRGLVRHGHRHGSSIAARRRRYALRYHGKLDHWAIH